MTSVTPASGPIAGGTVLTIGGTNLGSDGQVTVDGKICASRSHSASRAVCVTPPSVRSNLLSRQVPVVVTPAGGPASAPIWFTYSER